MDISQKEISEKLKNVKTFFKEDLKSVDYDSLYIKYLGKNGEINKLLQSVKEISDTSRIEILKEVNKLKKEVEEDVKDLKEKPVKNESLIDLTIPVKPSQTGALHPVTIVSRQLNQFFHYYGFSVYDGPEIESDHYNFEIMGVSKDHPAREMQDTLYIMQPEWLLRTQTSSIEARQLEKQDPPIRFVFPGKTYRNETANRSNGAVFDQFQGVCVDKNINLGHLKWMFTKSLKYILGEDTVIRFRAKYYPEVEPGMSPDIQCKFCKGDGCEICKYRGWIEIAGGGMIHPKTLEMCGIDPTIYSGFAFGWGLDRIAMARFNIKDIRILFSGNIIYQ